MDEQEDIFGSPDVIFNILKKLRIDDNVNITDFTFVYRKMYDCLPKEYVEQITIKDYLNSLEILREITKMMDWENSGMSFRKTLERTKFDPSRPFNEENKLTYSKICSKEINKDNKKNRNNSEINELKENNSTKRKIDEEEISRPYKKIRTNIT
ncbi:hypothetical protein LY90DRAFT_508290 [Neocallimastix californiae]|uniref:Uncharacterized protein n=1 Tax=Neocallimastix californiae TaxID=1754190 RepID=A0A1Y2CYY7_9FUNG|nr:hypothetical protein LY90DRAFT_508290 [Neocallimastix californiae]|eukprot:ORY52167.1 hypothetical protein LY90DRAFT_508290 [Neocallimastix californiae]